MFGRWSGEVLEGSPPAELVLSSASPAGPSCRSRTVDLPSAAPFRFAIQARPSGRHQWRRGARRRGVGRPGPEGAGPGYSALTVSDHLDDQYAITPAIMAAADATTKLRVGSLVFDNDYRHPVVLAKEAATIDLLSGGRVEFGLGAGWMTTDYEQAGIP